ncbi:MAG: hypothetical protein ABW352_21370 [Polyangiales bacterium]
MTVSWLQLERYALGELAGSERDDVERRLAESSADRACLDTILNDTFVMPPLPAPKPALSPWWWAVVPLAAAFALMMIPTSDLPGSPGVKGGEVAITLLSERTGSTVRGYRDGERFKLLVTCPPAYSSRLAVVMFQDGQRYQPLAPADLACGNQVPWPGAFTLDGAGEVEVCVTWSDKPARSARELEPDVVCTRLKHE